MKSPGNDTIAAVATPAGAGGIGIVRISGPDALAVAGRVFQGRGGRSVADFPPFRLGLGTIVDPESGEPVDEALAVRMPEGGSYTGEPTVEFHAHGGRAVLEAVLRAAVAGGARLAAPGEFTKRAFLGGRMDLSQAEAVAAIIGAESEAERRGALLQLRGGLATTVRGLRGRLLDLVSGTEAALDFGDEEGAGSDPSSAAVAALAREIRELSARGRTARSASRGARVVIAGRTNSGKSSIFNMLLEFDRSLVAPDPGTTRDYVEERSVIGGTGISLIDTAGIRWSDDPVEAEGIARGRRQFEEADLLVLIVDGSRSIEPEDLDLIDGARRKIPLIVLNKDDLPALADRSALRRHCGDLSVFTLSALTGAGIPLLVAAIGERCREVAALGSDTVIMPNLRHQEVFERAATALDAAAELVSSRRPLMDQVAAELRRGLVALDEITGESATEEIIETIFSRFCVGK